MHTNALAHVSDEKLLSDLRALIATEREATVTLLAHLAEVDARELYKPTPYPSMFAYCTRVLLLAEAVAYKRIRAARIARSFPQILEAIADGRMHVTGVAMLAPHITAENIDEVIVAATHRSKQELEILVARLAPRPDVPAKLRRLPAPRAQPTRLELDPDPVPAPTNAMSMPLTSGGVQLDPDPVPERGLESQPAATADHATASRSTTTHASVAQAPRTGGGVQLDPDPVAACGIEGQPAAATGRATASRSARVRPLSPERFALQMTIGQVTRDKLERARLLLTHTNASGDLAEVIDRALDALLEKLEKQKFGATDRPRAKKARPAGANARYTQNADKREIHERDGEQCAWISPDGVRCTERGYLQLDHQEMVCRGGTSNAEKMGLRCHAHNQYEAERQLGVGFMREKRVEARAARATKATASAGAKDAAGDVRARSEARKTDLELALRSRGYKVNDVQEAIAELVLEPGASFDARLEAALTILGRSRCEEGAIDGPAWSRGFDQPRWSC